MRIYDTRGRPKDITPLYIIQTQAERFWTRQEFIDGTNIIGVRISPAFVYVPHDLPTERIIAVKDETGAGDVTVRIY